MLSFSVFQNKVKGPSVSLANQIGSSSNDTRAQHLCTGMAVKCAERTKSSSRDKTDEISGQWTEKRRERVRSVGEREAQLQQTRMALGRTSGLCMPWRPSWQVFLNTRTNFSHTPCILNAQKFSPLSHSLIHPHTHTHTHTHTRSNIQSWREEGVPRAYLYRYQ
jgi:hypothetical protein